MLKPLIQNLLLPLLHILERENLYFLENILWSSMNQRKTN